MSTRTATSGAAVAAAFLCLGSCTFAFELPVVLGDDPAAPAVRAAIDGAWSDHIAAAMRKDLDGVLTLYADDATYALPGNPLVRGRDALRAMEARGLEAGDVIAAQHLLWALRVDGDFVHELGSVVGDVSPTGKAEQNVEFHFTAMWHRATDGKWRILHIAGQTAAPRR